MFSVSFPLLLPLHLIDYLVFATADPHPKYSIAITLIYITEKQHASVTMAGRAYADASSSVDIAFHRNIS
jgi:hypothetical protein